MPQIPVFTPDKFTTFGTLLRYLRRKANLTQLELSIAVGYSESQISRLEQDERSPEAAILSARFVPALYIDDEPDWVARLLELGAATHANLAELVSATKTTPQNLPLQLTTFIGREKEQAEITGLIAKYRLVTLVGAGGVGKTRLALQAASSLLDDFQEGVWLINLAPVADPAFVPQTVMEVLDLKEQAGRPLVSTLINYLLGKRTLLILDNCEHLLQACAELAEALLHACPEVHILSTSRERLGVSGERVLYVPSLSLPDPCESPSVERLSQYESVRLFVERAAAVTPDFTLTQENGLAIAQICQRLDGIPLALELAAARSRMLPVEQIVPRLDDAFRLLTGGSRTELPRHQTLKALIDWSHALLTPTEQSVFRRLAVFAGGWTPEAAEAVCMGNGVSTDEVFDLLAHLLDKSLILADGHSQTARYRMLETIRQYALSKLEASGEAEAVRQRHAEFYLALAEVKGSEEVDIVPAPARLDQIELEHANLRAALAWSLSSKAAVEIGYRLAVALGSFWVWRSYLNERKRWMDIALACLAAEQIPLTRARARLLFIAGSLVESGTHYVTQKALLSQSLEYFQAANDRVSTASILRILGYLAREVGDLATARLHLEQSLAIARELGDKSGIQQACITLGGVAVRLEDTAWATALIEEGLALSRQLEDWVATGWALNHLGHVAQLQGKYECAWQYHLESLATFEKIGAQNGGVISSHHCLGETALGQNGLTLAKEHFAKALELSREYGAILFPIWCLAGLAGVAAVNEEPERAAWLWGAAEALRPSGLQEAPAIRAVHERLQAEVRNQLGVAVFNAKWAEGQSASLEQAIAEATR